MISKIKDRAKQVFSEMGYTSIDQELWKYTNIKNFTSSIRYNEIVDIDINSYLISNSINIILLNGMIAHQDKKQIEGVQIFNYEQIVSSDRLADKFLEISNYNQSGVVAHNTSEFKDAIYIKISSRYNADIPINIISLSKGIDENKIIFPRIYVHAEENSNSKFFIQHINTTPSTGGLINSVTEFCCENSAQLEVIHSSNIKSQKAIDSITFNQGDNSKIKFFSAAFGGDLYKSNIDIDIKGENCDNKFNILILGSQKNHIDYYTNINHYGKNSINQFECRSMLKDNANGVFNGKILVEEGGSGTDSTLNNNNLLLSNNSTMQSNPQLEINCEDVKCSHGSTSGNLDKEALFYLRSRGILKSEAKQILVEGFIEKLLSPFNFKLLPINKKIKKWIQA